MNINKVKNVDGMVGAGVNFERIRRITGYLTGTTARWNEGKTAELKDRVRHNVTPKNTGLGGKPKRDEWER